MFEIQPKTLPFIPSLATTKNLHTMRYDKRPHALVELRKASEDAGMREQERQVNFALQQSKREHKELAARKDKEKEGQTIDWAAYLEARATYYLFEVTCAWGMSPGRLLQLLVYLVAGVTFIYMLAVDPPPHITHAGVWRVLPEDQVHQEAGEARYERVIVMTFWGALLWALYFSVLSTFHIGWRDLNVGTWLSRLQPREFTVRATGWVRVVSGIQSLISVYLLALSVLTYFGRPFE